MPDYNQALLARAMKDGKPVYDELQIRCSKTRPHKGTYNVNDGENRPPLYRDWTCSECKGDENFVRLNPNPMAQIAACQVQGWRVSFSDILGHVFIHGESPSWNRGPNPV